MAGTSKPAESLIVFLLPIMAVVQVAVGSLSPLFGIGVPIGDRSNAVNTPATPAGYAFTIWTIIFALSFAVAILQALPRFRAHPVFEAIRLPLLVAFTFCAAWSAYVQVNAIDLVSVVIIFAILVPLLVALTRLYRAGLTPGGLPGAISRLTVGLYAGWITAASFVNIAAALKGANVYAAYGVTETTAAIAAIAGASLLALAMTVRTRANPGYVIAVVWALAGIAFANSALSPNIDVAVAAIAGAALLVVTALALIVSGNGRVAAVSK